MKRIIFILTGLALTFTVAQAQRGNNGYHRGNNGVRAGGNHGHVQANRGNRGNRGNVRYQGQRNGNYGYNSGATRARGNVRSTYRSGGRYNRGGNYGYNAGARNCYQPRYRTRYVPSSCGTFRYRVNECGTYVPASWVYVNGCRRWQAGYWTWASRSRTRCY